MVKSDLANRSGGYSLKVALMVVCHYIAKTLRLYTHTHTGRKNGFASNWLSAKMMQICANWGINLSKGGKCRICIPIYTPV